MANKGEINLYAELLALRSPLSLEEAEYLVQFANGNTELLHQCEELANRGVSIITITDWLKVKIGLINFQPKGYLDCEALLKVLVAWTQCGYL